MANTFLAARGDELGRSLVEPERLDLARRILAAAEERGVRVVLPSDLVVTDDLDKPRRVETVAATAVPAELMAVDIGPAHPRGDRRRAGRTPGPSSGTARWGSSRSPPFDAGTMAVAAAVADCPGCSVIGGGETVAAARRAGVDARIDHVSTGGGASLELLAGKTLPGVEILRRTP